MCRDCARSNPRSNARITISDKQTHEIRHTEAILADRATRLFAFLTDETAEDAKSATAIPEAVIKVLAPSTYIVRLSVLVQPQSLVRASCQ